MKGKGVNTIVKKDCYKCGHTRFLANGRTKCARCGAGPQKMEIKKDVHGRALYKITEAQ